MDDSKFTQAAGIETPVICGAMYPCSNPELVAAVSRAGGLGIIQPVSMIYVHGHELRAGIKFIRSITDKPIGFNALVEKSSSRYEKRMREWVDIALEEGIKFFITALGNPKWVVEEAHSIGGVVYHDVTEGKWANKALDNGVDGLICVNNRAGGHAGALSAEKLYEEVSPFKVPLICAGGISTERDYVKALATGYSGVQMGTRFIATVECNSHSDYKEVIVNASEEDIVLTDKISGVPVSIIRTPYIEKQGVKAGPIAKYLLKGNITKKWMRMIYTLRSFFQLKNASQKGKGYLEYFQAGKSVRGISSVEPAGEIIKRFAKAADSWKRENAPRTP
ncbi:MAG: nitronate monooxygenase [Nitrospinota bacterium]|nr:nitronate monooxygenase [Nitrospinota bacterium]